MKRLIELISDLFSFFQKRPQIEPVDKGIGVYVYESFDKKYLYFLHNKTFYGFSNTKFSKNNKQLTADKIVSGDTEFYIKRNRVKNINRNSKEVYYVKP